MLPAKIDACVTDPPYHFGSIVKRFAKSGGADRPESKVGAYARHAKGFMGKTWDSGDISFQPETWRVMWEALKPGAHLAAFGGTRGFHRMFCAIEDAGFEIRDTLMWVYGQGFPKSHNQHDEWEGWGTALKPAWEPIGLFRKPLIGSVAKNLAAHRTGAINIAACRVEGGEFGRWPANVLHDGSDEVVEAFPIAPGQSGDLKDHAKGRISPNGIFGNMASARNAPARNAPARGDSGSASRFFYCAKATRADREDGCENLPLAAGGMLSETSGQHITRRDGGAPGLVHNNHPTVKPTKLMQWLCRLVTPPGGTILDPFMGSGSTGRGAVLEGFNFVGCEADPGYVKIAEARIAVVDLVG